MTTIDKTGTSIEDLICAFRKEHSLKDWELKYEIVKKPSSGFLGLFANKTAVVRFTLPALEERIAMYMRQLLQKMGVPFSDIKAERKGKTVYLQIIGCKEPGFLIGKNGSMLENLQYLLNRIYEGDRSLESVYVDVDDYRSRRENTFLRQFLPQINKVKAQGKPLTLDPMNAADRRIIHRHIEGVNGLRTLTIGEGEKKRIVIFSAKQSESEVLSQTQPKPSRPPQQRRPKREPK
jgi:spoIIIJ-associated protein